MGERTSNKDFSSAKTKIFKILSLRLHSEKEVRDKLRKKKYEENVIDQAINYFKGLKLIDDKQFAKAWISFRLLKPWGVNRIRFELKEKGIDPLIINAALADLPEEYSEEAEILQLAERRGKLYEGLEPFKVKQRLFAYLARRGFNLETINKTLKKI